MVRRRRARRRPSAQKPFTQLTPEAPAGGQVDEDVAHVMGHANLPDDDSGGVVGDVAFPGRVRAHLVQGHGPAQRDGRLDGEDDGHGQRGEDEVERHPQQRHRRRREVVAAPGSARRRAVAGVAPSGSSTSSSRSADADAAAVVAVVHRLAGAVSVDAVVGAGGALAGHAAIELGAAVSRGRVGETELARLADFPQHADVEYEHESGQRPEDEHVRAPAPDGVEGGARQLRFPHVTLVGARHEPEVGLGRGEGQGSQQHDQDDARGPRAPEPLRPEGTDRRAKENIIIFVQQIVFKLFVKKKRKKEKRKRRKIISQ